MRALTRGRILCFLGLVLSGCASGPKKLTPGESRGSPPDLRGRRVLVLPTQIRDGVGNNVTIDEEIAYALPARGAQVSWVFPPELEGILRRSPNVQASVRGLGVEFFLQVEVNRIGDPLYGEIRRLTTLAGADFAIIPVELSYGPDGAYDLVAVLLDPVSGRVLWFGFLQGSPGAPDDPGTLASVGDALARAVLPRG